jgi:hypothetical protein
LGDFCFKKIRAANLPNGFILKIIPAMRSDRISGCPGGSGNQDCRRATRRAGKFQVSTRAFLLLSSVHA